MAKKKTTKKTAVAKRKTAVKTDDTTRDFSNLRVGSTVMYGVVINLWQCPLNSLDKWVLIKNTDPKVYKSFSLYKWKNINGGELMTFHFIPPQIMMNLLELDSADIGLDRMLKSTGGKKSK